MEQATVRHKTLLLCTVQHSTLLLCTIQHSTLLLCTVQHNTLLLCTVHHSTLLGHPLPASLCQELQLWSPESVCGERWQWVVVVVAVMWWALPQWSAVVTTNVMMDDSSSVRCNSEIMVWFVYWATFLLKDKRYCENTYIIKWFAFIQMNNNFNFKFRMPNFSERSTIIYYLIPL